MYSRTKQPRVRHGLRQPELKCSYPAVTAQQQVIPFVLNAFPSVGNNKEI